MKNREIVTSCRKRRSSRIQLESSIYLSIFFLFILKINGFFMGHVYWFRLFHISRLLKSPWLKYVSLILKKNAFYRKIQLSIGNHNGFYEYSLWLNDASLTLERVKFSFASIHLRHCWWLCSLLLIWPFNTAALVEFWKKHVYPCLLQEQIHWTVFSTANISPL